MPTQCKTIKEFYDFFAKAPKGSKAEVPAGQRPPAAREVVILQKQKGNQVITKFKLKTNRRLYTLVVADKTKAKKLTEAFPVVVNKKFVGKKSLSKA